ncbi:polysaccharide pyruvyl transferase family protein [Zooshikella harenae]|uniref:Polysaccharide pyruvyl transferase family protein n=1 Tax=Zooshikella harenae TaxID=2827238 RepID=A0ABS5ZEN3_9GAMM|nr:polysaccharide pyruvyl transferase family protein [Zooshikella harenae]MBU2711720.1 polysaccharide pyruvyl transferase family protein [Zooshikella harenae]
MNTAHAVSTFLKVFKKKPWPIEKPIVMQFPINDICDARCQMCHIWQMKLDQQITPPQLTELLRADLFSEIRFVGINGGEPTLRKDAADLVAVLFDRLPKLQTISLITNALKSDRVLQCIDEIGAVVKQRGGCFDVMVSLDGVGEVHDRVRGRPGNFVSATQVLKEVVNHPKVDQVRIGCTVIRENVLHLHELLAYAIREGVYIKFRLGIPHQRLYTLNTSQAHQIGKTSWLFNDPYRFSRAEVIHFSEFLQGVCRYYETSEQQKLFYQSLIGQILFGHKRRAGCDWQHRGVTLSSRGELLYCAVQSQVICNALDGDTTTAYFGNEAHLHNIVKQKCNSCCHDYVGLPEGSDLFRIIVRDFLRYLGVHETTIKKRLLSTPLKVISEKVRFQAHRSRIRKKWKRLRKKELNTQKRSISTVLICGWYGTETLGDKAILAGIVTSLRKVHPELSICIASLNPYISEETKTQLDELEGSDICDIDTAIQNMPRFDLLVFGGGPIMAINEIAEMEVLFEEAKRQGVVSLLLGCGVGPLGDAQKNTAIARVLKLADHRIYRDDYSRNLATHLGVLNSKDMVAEDPAITWLHSVRLEQSKKNMAIDPSKTKLGVGKTLLLGLRDWPYHQYMPQAAPQEAEQIKRRFEHILVDALAALIENHQNLTLVPLPMCTNHFGGDDRFFYLNLLASHPKIAAHLDYSVLREELTPRAYVQYFNQADAVIAMRFHAAVFSTVLQKPTFIVDYTLGQGKLSAFAQSHQLPCASLESLTAEQLITQVNSLFHLDVKRCVLIKPTFPDQLVEVLGDLL